MVCFGLFHGLVFLPVILSICGSEPYVSVHDEKRNEKTVELQELENNRRRSNHDKVKDSDLEQAKHLMTESTK